MKLSLRTKVSFALCGVVVSALLICVCLFLDQCYPQKFDIKGIEFANVENVRWNIDNYGIDSTSVDFQILDPNAGENLAINYIGNGEKYLSVSGYCYIINNKIEVFNNAFVVQNKEHNTFYLIPTTQTNIKDLILEDGIDYGNSGLNGVCHLSFLPDDSVYRLYIYYGSDNQNFLIDTGEEINVE